MNLGLRQNEEQAIKEFSGIIMNKYGNRVKFLKLYGSKVRGDSDKYSDIDIFVLMDKKDPGMKGFILNNAYEIDLKYDVLLSVAVYDEKGFNDPMVQITPFIKNVVDEGVSV
ncbi:nucleotidyltransferase domain-containing protein [Candidatus Saganbacteria bacterium]|nr:nucleotidyltransferase domain-containing protein [Candidatus Saganbacteria bacterium]